MKRFFLALFVASAGGFVQAQCPTCPVQSRAAYTPVQTTAQTVKTVTAKTVTTAALVVTAPVRVAQRVAYYRPAPVRTRVADFFLFRFSR